MGKLKKGVRGLFGAKETMLEKLTQVAGWCTFRPVLGRRFRIRTDRAEGRIRVDPEQPRRENFWRILQSAWAF